MAKAKPQFVVVTTAHKGVFGGLVEGQKDEKTVTLTEAQMCVYWSADVQGVLGLATAGPSKNCKVTRQIPRIVLQDVTAVMDCTSEAEAAWRARPWN